MTLMAIKLIKTVPFASHLHFQEPFNRKLIVPFIFFPSFPLRVEANFLLCFAFETKIFLVVVAGARKVTLKKKKEI